MPSPKSDKPLESAPQLPEQPAPTPAEIEAQEAALAAEISAEHAAKAAEQADAADLAAREAAKEKASARLCPHDRAEMVKHGEGNPAKAGAWHCPKCGCCFKGREVREGHPACAQVTATP